MAIARKPKTVSYFDNCKNEFDTVSASYEEGIIPSSSEGFTLLELIIAMALLTIITFYTSAHFSWGRRTWELSSTLERKARVDAVQGVIRTRLTAARGTQGKLPLKFEGTDNSVQFVAALPGRTEPGGIYQMRIEGRTTTNELQRLQLLQWLEHIPEPESEHFSLMDDISSVRFRYYGQTKRYKQDKWHDAWIDENQLPQLVSIVVEFPDADIRRWPELIVELVLED